MVSVFIVKYIIAHTFCFVKGSGEIFFGGRRIDLVQKPVRDSGHLNCAVVQIHGTWIGELRSYSSGANILSTAETAQLNIERLEQSARVISRQCSRVASKSRRTAASVPVPYI